MNVIDRGAVRKYFMEKNQVLPIILIIVGIFTLTLLIGIVLIIVGIILYFKNRNDFSNEDKVDEITKVEIENAKERALKKFNLLQEQVSLIEPISVAGPANQPNSPTAAAIAASSNMASKLVKKALASNTDDPIYVERIGSDYNLRYTLVNITTFLFSETQLYIYYSNVDITTGLIFSEGTYEIFYSDIESIYTSKNVRKIFNQKQKKYEKVVYENMFVYTGGSYYQAGLPAYKEGEPSKIDNQFSAMRNLIREKKQA